MKGQIYNILFNSTVGTGTIENKTYFFDWSNLPSCKYKGTFSLITATHTVTASCVNVFVDIGSELSYPAMGVTGNQLRNGYMFIGNLGATSVSANSYLYCDNVTNPPFYLLNKPSNNQVSIRILNNDSTQSSYATNATYSMVLSLECLE